MATLIPSKAPNLPIATVEYEARYQDQFTNVLRLYFNTIDNAIGEIIRILAYTGPFDTVYANTVDAANVNTINVNTTNLTALFAAIQQLQANTVTAANFQGGNGVFNNLTGSNVNASLFTGAGYQLNFPHIAASDSTDQYADADDDPTLVTWNTLDSGLGWTLNSPGSATADHAGVYKITYSLQFINTANAIHYATVWMKVNGNDVANSSTIFAIPARKSATAGEEGYLCGYSEVTFVVDDGDEIELWWATDKAYESVGPTDGVYIFHDVAQTTPYARPAIPSAIGSIVYLSAPPDPKTQITPIGVSGYSGIGTPTIVMT
jgi:hypothetical protein